MKKIRKHKNKGGKKIKKRSKKYSGWPVNRKTGKKKGSESFYDVIIMG